MAMIKCSECGAEVSDKAEACVKCGAPINRTKTTEESALTRNRGCGDLVLYGIVAVVVIILIAVATR